MKYAFKICFVVFFKGHAEFRCFIGVHNPGSCHLVSQISGKIPTWRGVFSVLAYWLWPPRAHTSPTRTYLPREVYVHWLLGVVGAASSSLWPVPIVIVPPAWRLQVVHPVCRSDAHFAGWPPTLQVGYPFCTNMLPRFQVCHQVGRSATHSAGWPPNLQVGCPVSSLQIRQPICKSAT